MNIKDTLTLDRYDSLIHAIQAIAPTAYALDADGDSSALLVRDLLETGELENYAGSLADVLRHFADEIERINEI